MATRTWIAQGLHPGRMPDSRFDAHRRHAYRDLEEYRERHGTLHGEEMVEHMTTHGERGSHRVYTLDECRTVVSMHTGDMPIGTWKSIENDMAPCMGKRWLST